LPEFNGTMVAELKCEDKLPKSNRSALDMLLNISDTRISGLGPPFSTTRRRAPCTAPYRILGFDFWLDLAEVAAIFLHRSDQASDTWDDPNLWCGKLPFTRAHPHNLPVGKAELFVGQRVGFFVRVGFRLFCPIGFTHSILASQVRPQLLPLLEVDTAVAILVEATKKPKEIAKPSLAIIS
jgi:hypothetical protein